MESRRRQEMLSLIGEHEQQRWHPRKGNEQYGNRGYASE